MGDQLVAVLREAIWLAILIAAPPLLAATGVGLAMALVQTTLRIEERSLSVVPRIAAALLALVVAGPWIGAELQRFTMAVLAAIPGTGRT